MHLLIYLRRVGPILVPRFDALRTVIEADLLEAFRVDMLQQHGHDVHERGPSGHLVFPRPLHQIVQHLRTVLWPFHNSPLDHVS